MMLLLKWGVGALRHGAGTHEPSIQMANSTFILDFEGTQQVLQECIDSLPEEHRQRILKTMGKSGLLNRTIYVPRPAMAHRAHSKTKLQKSLVILQQLLLERGIRQLSDLPLPEEKVNRAAC